MTLNISPARHPRRRGLALVLVLVSLAAIALLVGTITVRILANRHMADRRANQLQAGWLARAGVELACGRLLAEPAKYRGESVELMPRSHVLIQVEPGPNPADGFKVTSEARYPAEGPGSVMRSVTRHVRRVAYGTRFRIEIEPVDDPGKAKFQPQSNKTKEP